VLRDLYNTALSGFRVIIFRIEFHFSPGKGLNRGLEIERAMGNYNDTTILSCYLLAPKIFPPPHCSSCALAGLSATSIERAFDERHTFYC